MIPKKVFSFSAALVAVGLLLSSCAASQAKEGAGSTAPDAVDVNTLEQDETAKPGGKLVVGITGETNGWNPGVNQWSSAATMVGASFLEPLMTFNKAGDYVPWLATSVKPIEEKKFDSWRIVLHGGITFHNGEALDAKVVKKNLDFYRNEGSLSVITLKPMIDDVVVVDDLTVDVKLTKPWSSFPGNLAGPNGYMMASAMLDSENKGVDRPIGTGPFVFDKWVRDNSLSARKNPSYWQAGQPYLDEIEFRPIPDTQQRVSALESGDLDVMVTNRPADVQKLRSQYSVITDYKGEKVFIMLNTAEDPAKLKNPFKNVHARRALIYATDRDQIRQDLANGEELSTSSTPLVGSSKWAMNESDTGYYPYDPQRAREEIAAYQKDTGESEFAFTITGFSDVDSVQLLQILQAKWAEFGIKAKIDTVEYSKLTSSIVLGGFQATYFRNYGYLDPDFDHPFLTSDTAKGLGVLSINFTQHKDPEIDKAFNDARATDDFGVQKDAYQRMTRRMNDAATHVWLYNNPYAFVVRSNIRGLNPARGQVLANSLAKPWLWAGVWKK